MQFITYKALTFSNEIIMIDSCRAYHSGPVSVRSKKISYDRTYNYRGLITPLFFYGTQKYFVEIDIVMDPDTRLKKSHDLAQELQDKLEDLEDVDRAFVHVDYEIYHKPVKLLYGKYTLSRTPIHNFFFLNRSI